MHVGQTEWDTIDKRHRTQTRKATSDGALNYIVPITFNQYLPWVILPIDITVLWLLYASVSPFYNVAIIQVAVASLVFLTVGLLIHLWVIVYLLAHEPLMATVSKPIGLVRTPNKTSSASPKVLTSYSRNVRATEEQLDKPKWRIRSENQIP